MDLQTKQSEPAGITGMWKNVLTREQEHSSRGQLKLSLETWSGMSCLLFLFDMLKDISFDISAEDFHSNELTWPGLCCRKIPLKAVWKIY